MREQVCRWVWRSGVMEKSERADPYSPHFLVISNAKVSHISINCNEEVGTHFLCMR